MTIETYPEMNVKIVELLRWVTDNPVLLYAAQRIEELEVAIAHLERLDAASQRVLAQAMRENRVHAECLETAVDALRLHSASADSTARYALNYIRQCLAKLEPEEKAE